MDDSESNSPVDGPSLRRSSRSSDTSRRHRSSKDTQKLLLSGSGRDLARLFAQYQERDTQDLRKRIESLQRQLYEETERANAAEERSRQFARRFKEANDARTAAENKAGRTSESLNLHKLRLEQAQAEINRAQEIVDSLQVQKEEAEKAAADARSQARLYREKDLVQRAREEGRRLGIEEGLARGRRMGFEEGKADAYARSTGTTPRPLRRAYVESVSDEGDAAAAPPPEEPIAASSPPPQTPREYSATYARDSAPRHSRPPTRQSSVAPESALQRPSATPQAPASPIPVAEPPKGNEIHPIIVHNVASPSHPHVPIPPDNWIPSMDGDLRIRLPPPHEMGPLPPSPSPSVALLHSTSGSDVKPVPVPPPANHSDSAISDTESIPAGQARHRRRRSSGSQSTTMSQFEILYPPGQAAPVAPTARPPYQQRPSVLSAIAEERERTPSVTSPPNGTRDAYQSPPYAQSTTSTFYRPQQASSQSPFASGAAPSPAQIYTPDYGQSNQQYYRPPRSPASSSESGRHMHAPPTPTQPHMLRPPSPGDNRNSLTQSLNSGWEINVEPPSRPDSLHSGNAPMTPNLLSAGDADRPLPAVQEDTPTDPHGPVIPNLTPQQSQMNTPQEEFPDTIVISESELPQGFIPASPMPGGFVHMPQPPVISHMPPNFMPAGPSSFPAQPSMPPPVPPSFQRNARDVYGNIVNPAGVPLPQSVYNSTPATTVMSAAAPTDVVIPPRLPAGLRQSAFADSTSESDEVSSGVGSVDSLTTPPARKKKLPKSKLSSGATYAAAPVPSNVIYPAPPTPRSTHTGLSSAARVPLPPSTPGSAMSPHSSASNFYSRTPGPYRAQSRAGTAAPLSPIMGSARAGPTPLPIPMPFSSPGEAPINITVEGPDEPVTIPEPMMMPMAEPDPSRSPMSSYVSMAPSNSTSKAGTKKGKKKGTKGR